MEEPPGGLPPATGLRCLRRRSTPLTAGGAAPTGAADGTRP